MLTAPRRGGTLEIGFEVAEEVGSGGISDGIGNILNRSRGALQHFGGDATTQVIVIGVWRLTVYRAAWMAKR